MVYIKLPVAKTSEKPSCIDFVVGFFFVFFRKPIFLTDFRANFLNRFISLVVVWHHKSLVGLTLECKYMHGFIIWPVRCKQKVCSLYNLSSVGRFFRDATR